MYSKKKFAKVRAKKGVNILNQEKIGKFLCEVRKEQGMTQQQLADAIGVSNKTVSKWECGKGMPEISLIPSLCQVLHISVNEFISGERLSEETYSQKAEENMMKFIKETENHKKWDSIWMLLIIGVAISFGLWYTILSNMGTSKNWVFLDKTALFAMVIVTTLLLIGTKLTGDFGTAFVVAVGKRKVSEKEMLRAKAAVKLVSKTWLVMGLLVSCIRFMAMIYVSESFSLFLEALSITMPMALIGVLYGLTGYLLLIPVQMKLEIT